MHISITEDDIGAALRSVNERLSLQAQTLARIETKAGFLMALVAIEQGDLDAIATTVSQAAETLQKVLDSETPLSPADESGVQEALTKLLAVGPKVPTDAPLVNPPADPGTDVPGQPVPGTTDGTTDQGTPVPGSSDPVVTDPAAGDAPVTDPAAGDAPVTDPAAAPDSPVEAHTPETPFDSTDGTGQPVV